MTKFFSRREFLKLAGVLPFSFFVRPPNRFRSAHEHAEPPNFLVIVFDAWSASNTSVYGYERETMPLLESLVENAVVYHNHYAGGNFTTPGTASLLTGVLPWSHRAIQSRGFVAEDYVDKNLFSLFDDYYRLAYTHNHWAEYVLEKFIRQFNEYVPRESLFLTHDKLANRIFKADEDIATLSWVRAMKSVDELSPYSLYFSRIYDLVRNSSVFSSFINSEVNWKIRALEDDFPRGLPNNTVDNYFLLEDAIDYFKDKLQAISTPFVSYLHFFPPHAPYNTRKEFYGIFSNVPYSQPRKPKHIFCGENSDELVIRQRTCYDEFLRYVDEAFYRFYYELDRSGLLDHTYIVLTSDHGELFERGITGHRTPCLFQPIVKIPLFIFEPGRKTRFDVFENTSAVDVLPTLLNISKKTIPDWIEGEVLPPFVTSPYHSERDIFSLEAKHSKVNKALDQATVMLIKGNEKLIHYFGYDELQPSNEKTELFNLKVDPEEVNDVSSSQRKRVEDLLEIVKGKLLAVNQPFLRNPSSPSTFPAVAALERERFPRGCLRVSPQAGEFEGML